MKFWDKFAAHFGMSDTDDDDRDYDEPEAPVSEPRKGNEQNMSDRNYGGSRDGMPFSRNVVDFHSVAAGRNSGEATIASLKMKVVVVEPKTFDDAQQVANCLRERRPVVINFEKTDNETAKRIIDFISGTTYALNGDIKKVGRNVFLCAPNNVNVSYTEEDRHNMSEMPWLKS